MTNSLSLLHTAFEQGRLIDALPTPPATRADAYALQAGYEAHSDHSRYGWKIAATSAAGQAHINVDGPIAGRLLAERMFAPGSQISLTNNRMLVCEPEFAFRFGVPLPGGQSYMRAAVMDAVATMHLSLEIPDSRFSDFTAVGAPSLIADNACARELIVGPPVTAEWRNVDLSAHAVAATVDNEYQRAGSGAAVLGDPRDALTWLVNEVAAIGVDIQPGELVTTGTCMTPLEITPGDHITADYGAFGSISAAFVA